MLDQQGFQKRKREKQRKNQKNFDKYEENNLSARRVELAKQIGLQNFNKYATQRANNRCSPPLAPSTQFCTNTFPSSVTTTPASCILSNTLHNHMTPIKGRVPKSVACKYSSSLSFNSPCFWMSVKLSIFRAAPKVSRNTSRTYRRRSSRRAATRTSSRLESEMYNPNTTRFSKSPHSTPRVVFLERDY